MLSLTIINLFYIINPKNRKIPVTQYINTILSSQGALRALSNSLHETNHVDAVLFHNAVAVAEINVSDNALNEWILKAVYILSNDITNRINDIPIDGTNDFEEYLNINYIMIEDEAGLTTDATNNTSSSEEEDSNEEEDESEEEMEIPPENTSPVRVTRAPTYYSSDESRRLSDTSESQSSTEAGNATNIEAVEAVEAVEAAEATPIVPDQSNENSGGTPSDTEAALVADNSGDSGTEPINVSNESNTTSDEQATNSSTNSDIL
jgi:hypothetical protein